MRLNYGLETPSRAAAKEAFRKRLVLFSELFRAMRSFHPDVKAAELKEAKRLGDPMAYWKTYAGLFPHSTPWSLVNESSTADAKRLGVETLNAHQEWLRLEAQCTQEEIKLAQA